MGSKMSTEDHVKGLVSVIIPGYKADFIIESIESALVQTYNNIEIIVVDDGSPNELRKLLSEYIETGKIRYVHQSNQKMAAARNNGIAHSKGEFLAFLDDDDLWAKDKLKRQISYFDDPRVGFVYSLAQGFNHTKSIDIPNFQIVKSGSIFEDIFQEDFIANSSVIIRKELFDQVGKFKSDPSYFGVDDCDMWTRITYLSQAKCVDETLTFIRLHDKQFSGDREIMLFNDLRARNTLIHDLGIRKKIANRYYKRIYFDIGYNLKSKSKARSAGYYIKSFFAKPNLKAMMALLKLPLV